MMPLHCALAEQKKDRASIKSPVEKIEASDDLSRLKERLKEHLKKLIGIPYRWGGSSSRGMDCSGLTKYVYAEVLGIDLPHNSAAQCNADVFEEIAPSTDELNVGDLLFFGPRKKNINHVGIYLSDGKFIHASRRLGVSISSLNRSYWKKRLITTKRLKDLGQL
jgi:lipoprotein Spr